VSVGDWRTWPRHYANRFELAVPLAWLEPFAATILLIERTPDLSLRARSGERLIPRS
jgi:hypothetical protein